MTRESLAEPFVKSDIKKSLQLHAKALDIPSGAAEIFIDKTLSATQIALKSKNTITKSDLTRIISKELKKYHKDFAYVYENRDKIV